MLRKEYSLLFALAAVVLLGASCSYQKAADTMAPESATQNGDVVTPETMNGEDEKRPEDGAIMEEAKEKDDKMTDEEEPAAKMMPAGTYQGYSPSRLAAEQAAGKKAVLFFYAAWCPFCRAADAAFQANLDKLPAGVALLKVDYDKEDGLKQKYGITYQHTFVQVDAAGESVSKWNGGDIDNLNRYLK